MGAGACCRSKTSIGIILSLNSVEKTGIKTKNQIWSETYFDAFGRDDMMTEKTMDKDFFE